MATSVITWHDPSAAFDTCDHTLLLKVLFPLAPGLHVFTGPSFPRGFASGLLSAVAMPQDSVLRSLHVSIPPHAFKFYFFSPVQSPLKITRCLIYLGSQQTWRYTSLLKLSMSKIKSLDPLHPSLHLFLLKLPISVNGNSILPAVQASEPSLTPFFFTSYTLPISKSH